MIRGIARVLIEWSVLLLARMTGRARQVHGVEIMFLTEAEEDHDAILSLEAALDLVHRQHPLSLRRIRDFLGRVVVLEAGLPEYRSGMGGATLPLSLTKTLTPEELALVLVHEATHGRLYAWGIREGSENRERIEEICVGRELALLAHLPAASPQLADFTRHKLEFRWWESPQHKERVTRELRKLRKAPDRHDEGCREPTAGGDGEP